MAYVDEHSSYIKKNLKYIEYKSVDIGDGVKEIYGREAGSEYELCGHRFDKEKFSPEEVQDWLVSKEIKYAEIVPAVSLAEIELDPVDVQLISLLYGQALPSNRQGFILKLKGKDSGNQRILQCKLVSKDKKTGQGIFIAMKGNYSDTDEEFYKNETVEKSAHEFLINKGARSVSDTNHNLKIDKDIYLVESWIDKSDPDSWEWRVKLDFSRSEDVMAEFDNITGVSIFAFVGEIQRKNKGAISMLKNLIAKFKRPSKKAETATNYYEGDKLDKIYSAIWAFADALVKWNNETGDPVLISDKAVLEENLSDLSTIMNSILFGKETENKQSEDQMTEEQIKALKDEIATELKTYLEELVGKKPEGEEGKDQDPDADKSKKDNEKSDAEKKLEAEVEAQKKKIKVLEDKLKAEKFLKRKSTATGGETDDQDDTDKKPDPVAKFDECMKDKEKWDALSSKEKAELIRAMQKAKK